VRELKSSFDRLLTSPTADELWDLQKALLALAGPDAARARAVAQAFHSCLRNLESKSASRTASRLGAVLGSAAVGTVSLQEWRHRQERGLEKLLEGALPAVLEIGAAVQTAAAWEIEARLIYDEFAWFLYEELWDVSLTAQPELSADDRSGRIDAVLNPLLDPGLPDADRATLLADVFMAVLAARVLPLISSS
jgi:hypothetical protein